MNRLIGLRYVARLFVAIMRSLDQAKRQREREPDETPCVHFDLPSYVMHRSYTR